MSSRQVLLSFGFAFLLLFLVNVFVVKGDAVIWMNQNYSDLPNYFFKYITYLGDGIIFVPIILIALFIRYEIAITTAITGILLGIIIGVLKRQAFSHLSRPKTFLKDIYELNFVDGVDVHGHFTFPSGHTATASAVGLLLALYIRKPLATAILASLAILVGISRVYLAQHFWVDITYGFLTGMAVTFLSRWLSNGWLKNKAWAKKSLKSAFSVRP
jgi:membrane-associated phospholipid phosphatase